MTGRASRAQTFLRIVLAGVVLVDLVSLFFFVGAARANAVANGFAPVGFYDVVSAAAVRAVIVVIGVAGAIAFGRQPGRLWEGLI